MATKRARSPSSEKQRSQFHRSPHFEKLEDKRVLAPITVDIVFLVDESESGEMEDSQQWLREEVVPELQSTLAAKGVTSVTYGLVGFGSSTSQANSFVIDSNGATASEKLVGSSSQVVSAMEGLENNIGTLEDGWDAIEHTIAEYNFRPGTVPVLILVQNQQGRTVAIGHNQTLVREGALAALNSKDVILNSLVAGVGLSEGEFVFRDLFDLTPYESSAGDFANRRVLGVEADVSGVNGEDPIPDGQHTYHLANESTGAIITTKPATESNALQISHDGSNTGPSGMVGSGKSVLIGQNITGGIGSASSGNNPYRAKAVPFEFDDISDDAGVHTSSEGLLLDAQDLGSFSFPFFGVNRTSLQIRSEGSLWFGSPTNWTDIDADLSVATGISAPDVDLIAVLMDSLGESSSPNADILWKIAGQQGASSHRLIVQWNDFVYSLTASTDDSITFQAVLFADGRMQFNYKDIEAQYGPAVDLFDSSAARKATVGIWHAGGTQSVVAAAGKFVPGLHSVFGSFAYSLGEPETETNYNYVRLAWDTGGAAWDLGAVVETSSDSAIADALRDTFVNSLADQVLRRKAEGKVWPGDSLDRVALALNLGGSEQEVGSSGVFRADDGTFTVDQGTSAVDDFAIAQNVALTFTNAMPSTSAQMNNVFKDARGELTEDLAIGNDGVEENISISIDALDNGSGGAAPFEDGAYIVELFFAELNAQVQPRSFDVVLEGTTVLQNYNPGADFAKNVSGTTEFVTDSAGSRVGVVKRFQIDVTEEKGGTGLQIDLLRSSFAQADPIISAVRILKAAPPRIEDVVLKGDASGFEWADGVDYSFATLAGQGQQLRPISTQYVNTIEIHFDGPVTFADPQNGSALRLVKTTRHADGSPINADLDADDWSFQYDAVNFIGRWTLDNPLPNGKYAIHLACLGVTGSGGQALDGDWENRFAPDGHLPTADNWTDDPERPFSAGNGTPNSANGEFRLYFALLAGDFNGDGVVSSGYSGSDGTIAADVTTSGDLFSDGNGDGVINSSDLNVRTTNLNAYLAMRQSTPSVQIHSGDLVDDEFITNGDLAVWRIWLGQSNAQGDIDGDGDTDGNDFLQWLQKVGDYSAWSDGPPAAAPAVVGDYAPWIVNVIVSGPQSTHAPFSFDSVDGSGQQLATVPVGGADTISIVFSENVNVSADSLFVVGLLTASMPETAAFSYDPQTYTATWRFEGWALADQYALVLPDNVTDVDGNPLDGEWTNPAGTTTSNSLVSEFPSGDGNPGGWFTFAMTLLPGDANLDGVVNGTDYNILAFHYGATFGKVFSQGDFNGDGAVNGVDFNLQSQYFTVNLQNLTILGDMDGDYDVDGDDLNAITVNYGMTGADWEDGDLDGDGEVTEHDFDLAFAQYGVSGLFLNVVG